MAKSTGFNVRCPGCGCGADDATLTIDLNRPQDDLVQQLRVGGYRGGSGRAGGQAAAGVDRHRPLGRAGPGTMRGRMVTEEGASKSETNLVTSCRA